MTEMEVPSGSVACVGVVSRPSRCAATADVIVASIAKEIARPNGDVIALIEFLALAR